MVSGCTDKDMSSEKYCGRDSDCVSASCCHPDSCINKDSAPDCSSIFCTQECVPDTMDCGQGHCACVDNECKAIIGG